MRQGKDEKYEPLKPSVKSIISVKYHSFIMLEVFVNEFGLRNPLKIGKSKRNFDMSPRV